MMTTEEKMQVTMLKMQLVEVQGTLVKTQDQLLAMQHAELSKEMEGYKHDLDLAGSEARSKVGAIAAIPSENLGTVVDASEITAAKQ